MVQPGRFCTSRLQPSTALYGFIESAQKDFQRTAWAMTFIVSPAHYARQIMRAVIFPVNPQEIFHPGDDARRESRR
jgi:hypothetical protein